MISTQYYTCIVYVQDGYCHINSTKPVAPITGYVNVTANNPDALKIALLKHGPISVAIDASQTTFTFYSNGIYHDKDCSKYKFLNLLISVNLTISLPGYKVDVV